MVALTLEVLSEVDFMQFTRLFNDSSYGYVNLYKDTDVIIEVASLGLLVSGKYYTSILGSITNRFQQFCLNVAAGMDFDAAYSFPGVASGDDGLQVKPSNATTSLLSAVVSSLGLEMTFEERHPGEPLDFLARVYQNPWYDDPNSFADPVRTVNKLTTFSQSKVESKGDYFTFVEKVLAYVPNDSQTPIIGDLITFVQSRCPRLTELVRRGMITEFASEGEAYKYAKVKGLNQRYAEAMFFGRGYPNDIDVERFPEELHVSRGS